MKIDLQGMEQLRDKVRSSTYMIDDLSKDSEVYQKIKPHIDDLFTFVQDVVSGREGWVVRSNEDSFD